MVWASNKVIPGIFFYFILIAISNHSFGQIANSKQVWYTYQQQASISKHWGYTFDMNHRREIFKNQTALISSIRLGATWMPNKTNIVTLGYAYFGSHLNNNVKKILTENRIWQQYQLFSTGNKLNTFHRFRLEERFRERLTIDPETNRNTNFQVRFRYMYQISGPVLMPKNGNSFGLNWFLATEPMFHLGQGIESHYFDQIRIIGGIKTNFTKSIAISILYMYTNQYSPSIEESQNIHTIRLILNHQLDFTKSN